MFQNALKRILTCILFLTNRTLTRTVRYWCPSLESRTRALRHFEGSGNPFDNSLLRFFETAGLFKFFFFHFEASHYGFSGSWERKPSLDFIERQTLPKLLFLVICNRVLSSQKLCVCSREWEPGTCPVSM